MDNEKISAIKKGCKINDRIFARILKKTRAGEFETEKDIEKFILEELKKAKAGKAFPPIVAVGENAVNWHHKPTKTKLENSGFCVIDFGARVERYCSDMTRTIYLGKASRKEKELYALVRKANEECIKRVRSGADGNKLYLHAQKVLRGYAKYFGHGLGHGLSKIIHAKPRISKKKNSFLKKGDVVTIEPGIYIPKKLGIRIEDDVLVLEKGKLLSKSTKKLVEIKSKIK